jgi:hypothetical protein
VNTDALPNYLHLVESEPVLVLRVDTPDDFVKALSPVYGLGGRYRHRHLIYRGHGRASWKLVPQSRRLEAWPLPHAFNPEDTWANRLCAEVCSLLTFCNIAEYQGLRIPEFLEIRDLLLGFMGGIAQHDPRAAQAWPPPNAAPALALAQHHGLPTCLLDFTRNPYVAAYFAAADVMRHSPEPDDSLAVWVVDEPNLLIGRSDPNRGLRAVVPPPSDNRTLQAQEGLFVYAALSHARCSDLTSRYEVDVALEDLLVLGSDRGQPVKLTLQRSHGQMLLHKLIKLGYDGSRLFPGYEGAALCVREFDWARIGSFH